MSHYYQDSQDFDPHDELFSSIMHPEVSGRAWEKRRERLSRNPVVVQQRAPRLPTGRMPHAESPDPDWLSSTMIEAKIANKVYLDDDLGDPIESIFDPDNSFLDDSIVRTERAKRALSLFKKQMQEEFDMEMAFGPGPSGRSVHYFEPLAEELYTVRYIDEGGLFDTGNLSKIATSSPEVSAEDACMLGGFPGKPLPSGASASDRRPRRERVDSWDTSIELSDDGEESETLLQRFDRLVTGQLSARKKINFELSSDAPAQTDASRGHEPSLELSHRSMDAVDIQRSLRSDFTDDLSMAVDHLAKIQALERFKGAVRAADDAAERAPPELAEAAALSAAQNFEAHLVDVIGAEDTTPAAANKLIEVVGYIGTTAPKYPVRTL